MQQWICIRLGRKCHFDIQLSLVLSGHEQRPRLPVPIHKMNNAVWCMGHNLPSFGSAPTSASNGALSHCKATWQYLQIHGQSLYIQWNVLCGRRLSLEWIHKLPSYCQVVCDGSQICTRVLFVLLDPAGRQAELTMYVVQIEPLCNVRL